MFRKDEDAPGGLRPCASSPALGEPHLPIPPAAASAIPSPASSSTNVTSVGRKLSVTIPTYHSDTNVSNPSPDPTDDGPRTPNAFEARNVSNVLQRLTSLIAMGSNVSHYLCIFLMNLIHSASYMFSEPSGPQEVLDAGFC